ncbi:MAG: helix-turn-helix transcriptional regulator [Ruminococcaceae bacterium]|nr:helix-turn-helix transcriptional regulator [Oscillospiraceae bacterium]
MNDLNKIVVTDIMDVITVFSPKGRFEKMNNRKYYGLSFSNDGQITYTHNQKNYISDPHHAIILPKGQSYTIYGNKSGEFPVINFECADFLCDTMIVLPIENIDFIMRDFIQMKNLFLSERNRTKVMSLFYNIIYNLWESTALCGNSLLLPAIKYLGNNYSLPELTNKTLADQCNISEVHFRKLFTEQFRITPRQYIIDIRINKAKQLLTEGIFKINAVSEKCGFSNPYHFSRLFKEKTGLTPTEYMQQNRIIKI